MTHHLTQATSHALHQHGALAALIPWLCVTSVGFGGMRYGGDAHAEPITDQPPTITVDLSAEWLRRDWDRCAGRSFWRFNQDQLVVASDSRAVLFWQIPTAHGVPYNLGPKHKWLRKCEPPSFTFWATEAEQIKKTGQLFSIADYPVLTWRWRLQRHGRDPEPAAQEPQVEIGLTIAKPGTNRVQELTYAWTPGGQLATYEVHKKTPVPGLFSYKLGRLVVESSPDSVGWIRHHRDVSADLRTVLSDDNPGRVLRVFVKLSADASRDSLIAHLADVRFLRPTWDLPGDTD